MPLWYLFFTAGHLDLGKVSCTSFFAHLFPGIPADFKSVGAVVLDLDQLLLGKKWNGFTWFFSPTLQGFDFKNLPNSFTNYTIIFFNSNNHYLVKIFFLENSYFLNFDYFSSLYAPDSS